MAGALYNTTLAGIQVMTWLLARGFVTKYIQSLTLTIERLVDDHPKWGANPMLRGLESLHLVNG